MCGSKSEADRGSAPTIIHDIRLEIEKLERLTFKGNFCDIAQCRELSCPYGGSCSHKKVWERLKAYEETGLSPIACAQAEAERLLSDAGGQLDRIIEIVKADNDGKLIVLPCKRGDELWTYCTYPRASVYSFVVYDVSWLNGRLMLNTSACGVIDARDIGKTVFLTRDEAEKVMEARDGSQ